MTHKHCPQSLSILCAQTALIRRFIAIDWPDGIVSHNEFVAGIGLLL
jgi:hypothetical protein